MDMTGSVGNPETYPVQSLKEVTKPKESSVLENSADIVEAVRYVATTEDLSLPLDFNGSPIRRQKPAAH